MKIEDMIAKVGEDNVRQAVESDDAGALKQLFEDEGLSLTDEQLDHIAGGVRLPTRPRRTRLGSVVDGMIEPGVPIEIEDDEPESDPEDRTEIIVYDD